MNQSDKNDFAAQQQRALERMREMNERSQQYGNPHHMPPAPPFVKIPQNPSGVSEDRPPEKTQPKKSNSFAIPLLGNIKLPFLDGLKSDSDMTLILGILLILLSEKSDRKLLIALLYILM